MQENDAKKNRAGKRYDEEKQQCEIKDQQIAGHLNDLDDQSCKKAELDAQVDQSRCSREMLWYARRGKIVWCVVCHCNHHTVLRWLHVQTSSIRSTWNVWWILCPRTMEKSRKFWIDIKRSKAPTRTWKRDRKIQAQRTKRSELSSVWMSRCVCRIHAHTCNMRGQISWLWHAGGNKFDPKFQQRDCKEAEGIRAVRSSSNRLAKRC